MTTSLRRAAGSLLVVGLGSTELTALERSWLRLVRPAGVILFRRNIADAGQTRALLNEATALSAEQALRCVDLEGGTVDRLRDALAPMPSPQDVAIAASLPRRSHLASKHGELVGRATKAFGFNTTLAPVLDLAMQDCSAVMGTRAPASTPEGVIRYARGFLTGLSSAGVAGCGKHFPGLGGGELDSHLETPAIRRSMNKLWNKDLAPYRELRDELPMVMVNHASYPLTPSKSRPASVSYFWITKVLRKRIGYRGIIFSDDLEMGGILKFMPIEEAVIAAASSGMDLMEICHSPELILRAFEALIAEGERSKAFARLMMARSAHTSQSRKKLFLGGTLKALTSKQFEALRTQVVRFSEVISSTRAKEAQIA